jgi:hypothetical protein
LQQYPKGIGDGAVVKVGEALGAVAALQQERPAGGDFGQLLAQGFDFAGEHQGQRVRQPLLDLGQRCRFIVVRQLRRRFIPPACRGPGRLGVLHELRHRYVRKLRMIEFAGSSRAEANPARQN